MPRKNKEDYTQMSIQKHVIEKLKELKIHPNQSYSEVIEKLINDLK